MKASELKRTMYFRFPNQRKYRYCLEVRELPFTENIPEEYRGKMLIVYNNCKQCITNKDQEIEITELLRIKNFSSSYTTSTHRIEIALINFNTEISHILKDGIAMLFVYSIRNNEKEWVEFDTRNLEGFPQYKWEEMREKGLQLVADYFNKEPKYFSQVIK